MREENVPARSAPRFAVVQFLGPAFLVLALFFALGAQSVDIPLTPAPRVPPELVSSGPRRVPLGDPPVAVVNSFARPCMDCHQLFTTATRTPPVRLRQHEDIVLNHGMNELCLNCHDVANRNLLVLHSGETVTFGEAERVCAQCHDTTYRDWLLGAHGKTIGYWDKERGSSTTLKCTQCHDPHAPPFATFAPLPKPNTLRSRRTLPVESHGHDKVERDPLQMWRKHGPE